jgi:hypothetical protein
MYIRGNVIAPYIHRPDGDVSWTAADYVRAEIYEARYAAQNVPEAERKKYVLCAVMLRKFPGTVYPDEIMEWLRSHNAN